MATIAKKVLLFIRDLFWDGSPEALAEAARRREKRRIQNMIDNDCRRCF